MHLAIAYQNPSGGMPSHEAQSIKLGQAVRKVEEEQAEKGRKPAKAGLDITHSVHP